MERQCPDCLAPLRLSHGCWVCSKCGYVKCGGIYFEADTVEAMCNWVVWRTIQGLRVNNIPPEIKVALIQEAEAAIERTLIEFSQLAEDGLIKSS